MATIGDLFVNLNANTSNFEGGMNRASGSANGLRNVVNRVGSAIAGFMIYDVGRRLVGGFVDAAKAGINYNSMLEKSGVAWKNLLKDEKEATDTLGLLRNIAKNTPFEFEGLDKLAKNLTMTGFGGKDLEKNLLAVGDAVAGVGGGQEDINGVSRALMQMGMKGKISAEEMQQLAERGIPAYDLLSEAMGVSTDELFKMMQSGEVMSKDALPLLIGQMEKTFGGSMQDQAKTFGGRMSTLKDTFKETAAIVSKGLFDKLTEIMPSLIGNIGKFGEAWGKGGLMGVIKKFAPGIAPFVQMAMGIFKTLGKTVGKIIKSMSDFWNEHSSWLGPLIGGLFFVIFTIISSTITAIGNVVESGLAVVDGIINFFQNLFTGNFEGCWDSIKQIFSNGLKFAWNLMQVNFALNLPSMIKNFGRNFKVWIDDAWIAVKDFFRRGADDIWNFAKQGFRNAYLAVKEWMGKIPENVTRFMDDAINYLKGIDLFQIGKNIIQGLIDGVKNMAGGVVKAVTGAVGGAIEAARKALGINSPSKVFMEFGKFTGEGLAIGIDGENKRVKKASVGLSNSVIGGYSANLKGIKSNLNGSNSMNNNKNVNINVQNMNVADKGSQSRTLSQLNFLATV